MTRSKISIALDNLNARQYAIYGEVTNEEEYNSLNNLNKEIEKEINNKNLNLDAKNDTIINNLNKLKIKDLANDYYFFKSISSNK